MDPSLLALLRCPRCRSALRYETLPETKLRCGDVACAYASTGFPIVGGRPALIDFDASVIDRESLVTRGGSSPLSRRRGTLRRIREWAEGENTIAATNCDSFLAQVRLTPQPRVLVVGGGTRGAGTAALYAAADVTIVNIDVYASPDVDLIADGHRLPFEDGSFQGVWIQAVLEHVVDPVAVAAELHRVLASDGIVYAETPFLQPVHERAYDFTRFTPSGHRWLFRDFAEIDAGAIGGPGQSALWVLRYLGRSVFRSDKVGSLVTVAFFWLRYLDRLVDRRYASDAACGVFFLGRKAEQPLAPHDIIDYFPGVQA